MAIAWLLVAVSVALLTALTGLFLLRGQLPLGVGADRGRRGAISYRLLAV
jgi:hypothetical protein